MAKSIDSIPMETEDGIDLDDPFVILFRAVNLERNAKAAGSDLHCPTCKTNLPYNHMTVAQVSDGTDANFNPVHKTSYFCPLCQEYFDKD
jgi:hypothetical protein